MNCANTAVALLILLVGATDARADWLFAGYLGASHTPGNTLTVTPASGPPQTVQVDSYEARPFIAPPYYGVRVGWIPHATRGLGVEGEWTHAKAYGEGLSSGSDLTYFAQSHGLNFVLGNAVYRFMPMCGGACSFNLRGGLGVSTPHVESTLRDVRVEHYQYGGVAWQLGAGVEYRVWQFVYGVGDARITRVSEQHLRGNGAEIAGSFFTSHVDFGIALRVPSH
jgi:lipid A oxidase